jgi:hypothetical protein
MATRFIFTPFSAEFPASNFPQLLLVNRRPALGFDAATAETCQWTSIAPVGLTGTLTVTVHCIMASATSGKVDFTGAVEAVTPSDATDLDAGDSFDTANAITAPTVPAVAGYEFSFDVTLTTKDSIAAGDYFRFQLTRDAADATNDTATGDCYVLAVELKDGA